MSSQKIYLNKKISLVLIIIGLIINPWLFEYFLASDGEIESIIFKCYIFFFSFCFIYTGYKIKENFNKIIIFEYILKFSLIFLSIISIFSLSEITLTLFNKNISSTSEQFITENYKNFSKQHLHPFYYFFFPQEKSVIKEINNETVSITENGFRGFDPILKKGQRLAFLIGGSTAFGWGSKSDSTTITGYLNIKQKDFLFINAGVPSWNSTQEFYRLSQQLLDYNPSLIITLNGANDGAISYKYKLLNKNYPPGTVESFHYMSEKIDDIRKNSMPSISNAIYVKSKNLFSGLLNMLSFSKTENFLSLILKLDIKNSTEKPPVPAINDIAKIDLKILERSAKKYIKNILLMNNLSSSYGSKFICVRQPLKTLTNNRVKEFYNERNIFMKEFYNLIDENIDTTQIEYKDMGAFFNKFANINMDEIFLDEVHLTDKGNELLAEEILKFLN